MSRRPVVRSISVAERRARLAVRHRLAPSARTDEESLVPPNMSNATMLEPAPHAVSA